MKIEELYNEKLEESLDVLSKLEAISPKIGEVIDFITNVQEELIRKNKIIEIYETRYNNYSKLIKTLVTPSLLSKEDIEYINGAENIGDIAVSIDL